MKRTIVHRTIAALLSVAVASPLPISAQQSAAPTSQSFVAPTGQNVPEPKDSFHLYVGEARSIKPPSPVVKTAIGNGKVISTAAVNAQELLIIANDAGRSTLHLWLQNGTEVTYAVEVGLNSPAKTFEQVREMFAKDGNIHISMVGNRVFLQAETLKPAQAQIITALEKAFPDQIVLVTGGDVALEERTVYLNAQLVEIKKNALEELGLEWDTSINGPAYAVVGDMKTSKGISGIRPKNENWPDLETFPGNTTPFATAFSLATAISSRIHLLRQQGDAYVVAEPRLTARCGGKADFTSGGELPIPTQNGLGSTNVDFKEYGIRLAVEPKCDKLGNIRAKVATEVSQIDNSVAVLGVPGLLTRKAESELDLVEGQAMLLSGLASYSAGEGESKVPFLGSIPLLGHLFKSTDSHGERSELVVIITPSFITPDSETVKKGQQRYQELAKRTDKATLDQGVKSLDYKPKEIDRSGTEFGVESNDVRGLLNIGNPNKKAAPAPVAPTTTPVSPAATVPAPEPTRTATPPGVTTAAAAVPVPASTYVLTGDAPWRPTKVYRSGQQTVIEMPKSMSADSAPTLVVVKHDSTTGAPVQYRLEDSRYVVDAIIDRAMLVAGAGYYRQSVTITRQ